MASHTAVTLRLFKLKAPRNDMITVDLKTQDTQLNSKTESNAQENYYTKLQI